MQKLASVKVYAIKYKCDLQVRSRILKGVHHSTTGNERPLVVKNGKKEKFPEL
jgi:hypothetical protein